MTGGMMGENSNVKMPPAWVMGFNARKHGYGSDHHPPLGRDFTAGDLRSWRNGWSDADAIIQAEGEGALDRWNRRDGWQDESGQNSEAGMDTRGLIDDLEHALMMRDSSRPHEMEEWQKKVEEARESLLAVVRRELLFTKGRLYRALRDVVAEDTSLNIHLYDLGVIAEAMRDRLTDRESNGEEIVDEDDVLDEMRKGEDD